SRPRRLVIIDPTNGDVETLYDPNPGFATLELGSTPQRLAIRTAAGVETYGYLVLPRNRRNRDRVPLVVVTYRCSGFLRGGVGDEYPVYPLAAQGFAVLCFDAPDDFSREARMDAASYSNWE